MARVQTSGGQWRNAKSKGAQVVGGHQVKVFMYDAWVDVRAATDLVSRSHDWRTAWRCPANACEATALPSPDLAMFDSPSAFRQETTTLAELLLGL